MLHAKTDLASIIRQDFQI